MSKMKKIYTIKLKYPRYILGKQKEFQFLNVKSCVTTKS